MLPLQTHEGNTPQLGGMAPSAILTGVDAAEPRQPKPKTLPCKYCSKRFRRVEHVQRHERTHTKEKPFSCNWDRCGKTFGRRHEKLVHLNEGSKDGNRPRKMSGATAPYKQSLSETSNLSTVRLGNSNTQMQQQHRQSHQHQHQPQQQQPSYSHDSITVAQDPPAASDPRTSARGEACNLDLLSDAALASEVNQMQPMMSDMSHQSPNQVRVKTYNDNVGGYQERSHENQQNMAGNAFALQPGPPLYDDYNLFMDEFASSSHFLPPHFEPDQQMSLWSRSPANLQRGGMSKPPSQFPSRFGSLAPDFRDSTDAAGRNHDDVGRMPNMRISVLDHTAIKNRLDEFSSVLPTDFVFPSRYTLTRFLEGYISGFHDQLPFIHLPTFSPVESAPELLLAILAVGAQYRFESNRGYALWYAAKAVALEQIRRRHSSDINALLPTPAAYSPHSTRPSPSATYRHSFASAQSERPATQETHREPYSANTPQARLETIQAVLLLFAVGLWEAKAILHEALSLQSNLSILIREDGLNVETSQNTLTDWEAWVQLEGTTRTKLIAYCFFNLCSTAYNMPPLILASELKMHLPLRSRLWRAESAWQWQDLRQSTASVDVTVHDAFSRLFGRSNQALPSQLSSLANYVLIHAMLQHIYLLKQTSFPTALPYNTQQSLKPEDVEEVTQALRVWQTSFEHQHQLKSAESGHFGSADSPVGGSLAYNATALLRLAFIRLYVDLPPGRSLETRDSMLIASKLSSAPLLVRSLRLHRAVFQAVHALSMLVKAGVNYVARTKSSEWSIQHSLCNFECAILLAKWLLTLASITSSDPPATPEERNLLDTVRRMLDETEFAVPVDPSLGGSSSSRSGSGAGQVDMSTNDAAKLRQLAAAVVRLWAETFKGTHIFEIVKVMGASLDAYADLVERPDNRTPPMGRLGPETSMG